MKRQIEAEKNQAQIIIETIKAEHQKDLKELDARLKMLQDAMSHENRLDENTHKAVLDTIKPQE